MFFPSVRYVCPHRPSKPLDRIWCVLWLSDTTLLWQPMMISIYYISQDTEFSFALPFEQNMFPQILVNEFLIMQLLSYNE